MDVLPRRRLYKPILMLMTGQTLLPHCHLYLSYEEPSNAIDIARIMHLPSNSANYTVRCYMTIVLRPSTHG